MHMSPAASARNKSLSETSSMCFGIIFAPLDHKAYFTLLSEIKKTCQSLGNHRRRNRGGGGGGGHQGHMPPPQVFINC